MRAAGDRRAWCDGRRLYEEGSAMEAHAIGAAGVSVGTRDEAAAVAGATRGMDVSEDTGRV